ncbi:hypothetical protein FB451DRAFT_1195426 [Mycena latifolia]|nr:hypothetical protein FB451DRAFT_1195426 [Mycena latifolia]
MAGRVLSRVGNPFLFSLLSSWQSGDPSTRQRSMLEETLRGVSFLGAGHVSTKLLEPEASSGLLTLNASPGELAKTACRTPPQDEAASEAHHASPRAPFRLLWSAKDACRRFVAATTAPANARESCDKTEWAYPSAAVPSTSGASLAVLPPDAGRRSTVAATTAPANARESCDETPTPCADPWAAAPPRALPPP